MDTRPNLGPGPETWQYQAQYLDGDELVGPLSDVLVVTGRRGKKACCVDV